MTEAGNTNVLKFTELTIMDNEKCHDAWEFEITKNMICAWHSSRSVCNGDSGGPLSCQPGILFQFFCTYPVFHLKSFSGFEMLSINFLSWAKFGIIRFDYLK